MPIKRRIWLLAASLAAVSLPSNAQAARSSAPPQLPNAPGKETVQKVCGNCHSANLVLGRGMTREEWSEVVASMISRGAKATQDEFAQVIDYLAKNFPPKAAPGASPASPRRGGGGGFTVGPNDKQIVDAASADRGKAIYSTGCESCHGDKARGTEKGPDLVRSVLVLHDRYGSTLKPFLAKGHPLQNGGATASLNDQQIKDLSNFLHQQVNDTLRSGPYSKVLNVLTGDPKAGAAYFTSAGCNQCHSPTGDLAGIASKYDPPTLQQRFLFPRTIGFGRRGLAPTKPVTATVTSPDGTTISGSLDKIDDFNVSLRDAAGEYHSWKRTPDLKVQINDPYSAHNELLDRYTDRDIHNMVAYLETLK